MSVLALVEAYEGSRGSHGPCADRRSSAKLSALGEDRFERNTSPLNYAAPPAKLPKRRGRPPGWLVEAACAA